MRNMNPLFITLTTVLLLFACQKEEAATPDIKSKIQSATLTFSNWTWDNDNKFSYANFNWPSITSEIVNDGALLLYVETPSGWAQLPRTLMPTKDYTQSQRFTYSLGGFRIIVQDSDLLQPVTLGTWTIKVLVVPESELLIHPNLDWSDYNKVEALMNCDN